MIDWETAEGLYLVKPHGELVYDGDKTAIAKARLFDGIENRERVLCSDGRAFGTLTLGEPEEIGVPAFDARFNDHRVTVAEREKWWPEASTLFLYPIVTWTPFDTPAGINVPPGTQTIVERIDWVERPPAFAQSASTQPASGARPAGSVPPAASVSPSEVGGKAGTLGVPSLPTAVAPTIPAIPAIPTIPAIPAIPTIPSGGVEGCNVAASLPDEQPAVHVDGAKEVDTMPFDIFKEGDRFCVYTVDGDGNKKGNTHGCHDTLEEARDQQKALYARVPEAAEKAQWTRAYINNLPDSAFLYVEPGGEKDEEGKTVPREKRHLPYRNAEGDIDTPHLRNALSRLGQPGTGTQNSERWLTESLRKRLLAKAQRTLERTTKSSVKELLTSFISTLFGTPSSILWKSDALMGFKASDGQHWLVLWTTNAFEDREEEIFSTQAIEDYVERYIGAETKGRFRYRHIPGSDFADIKLQAVVGRFLVEAGPFDQDWKGQAFRQFFQTYPEGHPTFAPQGWGASHGYIYHQEDRADKVYDYFDKKESSVVPADVAANPWNPSLEVIVMNQAQRDALLDEFRAIGGDQLAQHILEVGQSLTKDLEGTVAFKETETPEVPETAVPEPVVEEPAAETPNTEVPAPQEPPVVEVVETPPDEPPAEPPAEVKETAPDTNTAKMLAAEITSLLELDALGEAFKSFQGAIGGLNQRVGGIESSLTALVGRMEQLERADEDKLAEKEQELPRFPWGSSFRPSTMSETELSEKEKGSFRRPQPPEAISKIAEGLQR